MGMIQHKPFEHPVRMPTNGLVFWRHLAPVLKVLLKKAGMKISLDGLIGQEIDGGIHLKGGQGGGGDFDHPFKCPANVSEGTIIVSPGTTNSQMPTIGGSAMDALPPLTVSGSGYAVVWVRLVFEVEVEYSYVYASEFVSSSVEAGSSLPGDTNTNLHIMIASYNDGVKVSQPVTTSLFAGICDDGTGAGGSQFHWNAA